MRHWSLLGIRNWRVKPGRTAGALCAIALGVGVVIWVTCAYESVRLAIRDQVWFWIGRSHLSVESVYGSDGTVFQKISEEVKADTNVEHVTFRLNHPAMLHLLAGSPATRISESDEPPPATDINSESRPTLGSDLPVLLSGTKVQAVGINPATEVHFRQYDDTRIVGRMLTSEDTDAAVIDYKLAAQLDLKPGDRFVLRITPPDRTGETDLSSDYRYSPAPRQQVFTVVGLLEHRRIAKTQDPVVLAMLERIQWLTGFDVEQKRVTKIDMILKDTSPNKLLKTERQVRRIALRYKELPHFLVTSARAKLYQVEMAERQTWLVLLLLSCVALFTAFFVILSTLSMGMIERIGQLGTLRCLGVTRRQIAVLVFSEAVPLGVLGTMLGIPVGLLLAKLSIWLAPEYLGYFAMSRAGLLIALGGGGITTLLGALLPMVQSMRVSPLAASRPQSRPPPVILIWLTAALGIAFIVGHSILIGQLPPSKWVQQPFYPVTAVTLLYGGYALITPALILLIGAPVGRILAVIIGIQYRLLSDQVGRVVWRSAGICCGLMVGLSLIVSLVVHSQSLAAGWDFPKDFCEAFVYMSPPVQRSLADKARRIPGVTSSSLVNESTGCTVHGGGLFHFPWSHFVAGDPDEFFQIAKLEFIQGNKTEAIAKLKKGGYILVTPEFTRSHKRTYGDKVQIAAAGITGNFEIAGVVSSPALDIAANYFNAGGKLVATAVHVVMGTLDDLQRVFKQPDVVSMFLVNFDLPETTPAYPKEFESDSPPSLNDPAAFAEMIRNWRPLLTQRQAEIDQIERRYQELASTNTGVHWNDMPMLKLFRDTLVEDVVCDWSKLSPAQRWHSFREELVMRLLAWGAHSTMMQHASARALKIKIDQDLRRATIMITTIPMVALIVAALGVGNLMMANVTNRIREIAMLRAIGATKWQITRLIIGEAIVLGSLGGIVGLALGLHAAHGMGSITTAIWGFQPKTTIPWDLVGLSLAFTISVCLIAGVIPARHAARNNIIDALQTT